MSFENFKLNNNEALGDFTYVARFDFAEINEIITGGVSVQIATIAKGGGAELSAVVISKLVTSGNDTLTCSVGTTEGDPIEFNSLVALPSDTNIADYNSGSDFNPLPVPTVVAIAVDTDTAVFAIFDNGASDLTTGEVIVSLRFTDPLRFAEVAT